MLQQQAVDIGYGCICNTVVGGAGGVVVGVVAGVSFVAGIGLSLVLLTLLVLLVLV